MKIQVGKKELSEKQKKILRKVSDFAICFYLPVAVNCNNGCLGISHLEGSYNGRGGIPNSGTDNRNRFGNYFEFYSNVPFDFDCVNVSNFIAT